MFRTSTLAGLAAAAFVATGAVFFGATGSSASAPAIEVSPAPAATLVAATPAVATTVVKAPAPVETAANDACARKVKVVYAGYGEASLVCAPKR